MNTKYLTLAQAAKEVPSNPSASCVWRWCRLGLKARNGEQVKLEHRRIGGQIFTTHAWLESFFAALSDSDDEYFDLRRSKRKSSVLVSTSRNRDIQQASREVDSILGQ